MACRRKTEEQSGCRERREAGVKQSQACEGSRWKEERRAGGGVEVEDGGKEFGKVEMGRKLRHRGQEEKEGKVGIRKCGCKEEE